MAAVIREATTSDVQAVVALLAEVLAEFGLRFGEGSATDVQVLDLPSSYANHGGCFWVATEPDGRLLGTCGVFPVNADPADATYELRKMYLHRDSRGQGVGKRLLDVACAWTRARDGVRMVLDTVEEMTRAIAFYEANGFVRDDTQVRGSRCTRGYVRVLGAIGEG